MSNDWLEFGDEYFLQPRRSPDGRFVVAVRDSILDGDREIWGTCVLLQDERVQFRHSLHRPHNPHVNDDGVVVVEDWRSSRTLNGALLAFDRAGRPLWCLELRANIYTSGMSADGRHVFLATCNSDDAEHGGRTFLLEAASGRQLWSRRGWGGVRFDGNTLVADVKLAAGTLSFPFDPDGRLDEAHAAAVALDRAERGRGQPWSLLPRLTAAFKLAPLDLPAIEAMLAESVGKIEGYTPAVQAKIARFSGDLAHARGQHALAIECWVRALTLDPKSGVKRRLDKARATIAKEGGP